MMNVSQLMSLNVTNPPLMITGWLVSVGHDFYLIDWDGRDDYMNSPKFPIENKGLLDCLKLDGRLLFNGGGPLLFHPARALCYILTNIEFNENKLYLSELSLENDNIWIDINLNAKNDNENNMDWNDIFK
ncbi:hypothetical protein [Dickeya zeae]|uniref:hypothetical protein n=1 Tax=Dickeya zeae TaxID=204042 RepID=UPI000576FA0B|nr:hypothetical protein [Dickeya zeae]